MESATRQSEFKQSFERLDREYPANPKRVYLASCYRSSQGEYGVTRYIEEASHVARAMWKLGLAVLCPVKNTSHFGGSDVPDQVWLTGDFAFIDVCEAIVMHPNWEISSGARAELDYAKGLGLRVFYLEDGFKGDWKKLAAWAKKERDTVQTCTDTVQPEQVTPVLAEEPKQ